MNQLPKSLFIGIYPVLCLGALVISILHLKEGLSLSALGLFLTAFPMLFLLGKVFLTDVARTDRHLLPYTFLVLIGVILLIYDWLNGGNFGLLQQLGIASLIGWGLYVWWYSVFPDRSSPSLAIGKQLVDFSLEDEQGNTLSSKSFLGKKNIFLFYRGNWCPLCMTQIKEIANQYKELEANGIQTNLVSPQPHKHTKSLARKFNVGFNFLVDKDHRVAKTLNIFAKNGLPFGLQALGYDSCLLYTSDAADE